MRYVVVIPGLNNWEIVKESDWYEDKLKQIPIWNNYWHAWAFKCALEESKIGLFDFEDYRQLAATVSPRFF